MLSNHVTLIGHLGADPRTLTTHDGDLFTAGSIAISRRYTNRSGSTVDDTQWFGFVAFGSKAERILTSLRRGGPRLPRRPPHLPLLHHRHRRAAPKRPGAGHPLRAAAQALRPPRRPSRAHRRG